MEEERGLEGGGDGHHMRGERKEEGGHCLARGARRIVSCLCPAAAPAAASRRCTTAARPSLRLAGRLCGVRGGRGGQGRLSLRPRGAEEHARAGQQGEEGEGALPAGLHAYQAAGQDCLHVGERELRDARQGERGTAAVPLERVQGRGEEEAVGGAGVRERDGHEGGCRGRR